MGPQQKIRSCGSTLIRHSPFDQLVTLTECRSNIWLDGGRERERASQPVADRPVQSVGGQTEDQSECYFITFPINVNGEKLLIPVSNHWKICKWNIGPSSSTSSVVSWLSIRSSSSPSITCFPFFPCTLCVAEWWSLTDFCLLYSFCSFSFQAAQEWLMAKEMNISTTNYRLMDNWVERKGGRYNR